MKRTIFVAISCILLLGLALAGCENGGGGTGALVGVWPNPDLQVAPNTFSRIVAGINWTDVVYTGIEDYEIPAAWLTEWGV